MEISTELYTACVDGDIGTIKTFLDSLDHDQLQQNDDLLNDVQDFMSRALKLACIYGHFELVKFLCDYALPGAFHSFVTEEDSDGMNYAVANGHVEIVKYLCVNYSELQNFWDNGLSDALENACLNGHYEVVEYLIDEQFENDLPEEKIYATQCQCLTNSYEHKHIKLFKYLISKFPGIDFMQDDELVEVANDIYENGNLDLVKHLHANGAKINNRYGHYLLVSCAHGHIEVLKWMHENGEDIRVRNDIAIKLACKNGHLDVVQWLHEHGCDIRSKNDVLLREVAARGHNNIVRYLLNNGYSFNSL